MWMDRSTETTERERKRSKSCSEASVTAMHFTSFLIWRCFAVDAMPPREAPDIFRMFRVEGVYRAAALAATACLLYAALVFLDPLWSAAASLLVREQHERVTLGCAHWGSLVRFLVDSGVGTEVLLCTLWATTLFWQAAAQESIE